MGRALCVPLAVIAILMMAAPAQAQKSPAAAKAGSTSATAKQAKKTRRPRRRPKPARKLFAAKKGSAALAPKVIGFYSRGCLAGGERLAPTGPAWQAMRLSRNRNWGHPLLIKVIERLAVEARQNDGWNGLLVGDLAQPRGGPMLTGHASHQVGLDADIWLRPMPARTLSRKERETYPPISMLKNSLVVKPGVFSAKHVALIKRAASYPEVARIGVNPAIKHALCKAVGKDTKWLGKIQMWAGHHYHMHIRLKCPPGNGDCRDQGAPGRTSCAEANKWYRNLKAWLARPKVRKKKKKKTVKRRRRRSEIMMANLPAACRAVLNAKQNVGVSAPAGTAGQARPTATAGK